ncbi:hypothetical protein CCR85_13155 [Rhodothalassium salexigens]|uniref:hypothetical protein n=1 Tax=Rhodothalassium salexigens TaxID=1086 RepID=UPI00191426DB|nr:hypothetical protein [Rhodothalassium salexigens]MBK5912434.1 hypothetical protein [Rhodothalassium salexigens]
MPQDDLDPERLKAITSQMVEAITSPAYVEAMRKVKAASNDKRLDEAMRRLTPKALREQGVRLPEDMRISSRYFEEGFKPIEVGEPAGKRNLLAELHAAEPEMFDLIGRLRDRKPDLYQELTERLSVEDAISPLALCGCACGGAATACGGAGAG